MANTADLDSGFRVDTWQVQPRLGTLSSGGRVNRVEPRVMAVLVCLARNAPNVVTRDEFIRDVWSGRVVTDEVLSRCISLLRTALDDQARVPRLIQTLPRIGYRLLAEVEPLTPPRAMAPAAPAEATEPEGPAEPAAATIAPRDSRPAARADETARTSRRLAVLIASLVGAVVLAYLAAQFWRNRESGPASAATVDRNSVAVLPFVNRGDSKDDDYFSDGLTEELISRLSTNPQLKVVASTSAFALKDRPDDVREIGRKLGVAYVVEGNVRRDGDRVRIAAQLIDTANGYHLMTRTHEGRLSDIFTLQDEVASGIVAQLGAVLSDVAVDAEIDTAPPTGNIEAYELVLRGRHQFRIREEANIRRSIELFRQAIELDPDYVDAYSDLARAQVVLPAYSAEDREESFAAALATLERGAKRKPRILAASQDVIGFIEHARWHWIAADEAFQRALALRPRDSNLLQWYSQFLASVGRTKESLEYALRAKEVDVVSPVVNDRLAVAYLWNDDDALADRQFEVTRELGIRIAAEPDAYLLLLLRLGRYDEARDLALSLQRFFARPSDWLDPFLAALKNPELRPAAVEAVARAEQERNISRRYALGAWMHLGEDERALQSVLELLEDPGEFEEELLFAREARGLRAHPRFGEVLSRLGLVEYWDATGWPEVCQRTEGVIRCQ